MKSAALGLAEGSGAKLSHVLIETSPQQESEKTAFFLAWLGHCFKLLFQRVTSWHVNAFHACDWHRRLDLLQPTCNSAGHCC